MVKPSEVEKHKGAGVEVVSTDGEPKQHKGRHGKGVGVEEKVAACTDGEPKHEEGVVGSVEANKAELMAAIEERLATHYNIFTGSVGCILISSVFEFLEFTCAPRSAPIFLMPYLPPRDAPSIQAAMEKQGLIVLNPDLLECKLAVNRAIDAHEEQLLPLLADPEEGSDDKYSREQKRRESVEGFSLASGLAKFRGHMQKRLVFVLRI